MEHMQEYVTMIGMVNSLVKNVRKKWNDSTRGIGKVFSIPC